MTRVLVTGVAGFIGSHVADHCLRLGFEVIGADDLSGGTTANVPRGVDFRRGSVTDRAFVDALFSRGRIDYVYHLAAYAAEGLSHFIRQHNYDTNVLGSMTLINNAVIHDVRCFVFTSSIAVYGTSRTPMTEDTAPHPEDPYGISKYAVELDLEAAHRMFGLPWIVFRPHNVYGERQNIADRYRNVIGIFFNQLRRGVPMTVFGDGMQTRAFSHVDDVASIIARAPLVPDAGQQVFNVGADQPVTVLALAHAVARALDVEPRVEHTAPRNEVVHAFASHERARRVFGASRHIPLDEGLARMAAWVRTQPAPEPVSFPRIEVEKNLPPIWRDHG
jgi:UDP-glucose 4-epimerase